MPATTDSPVLVALDLFAGTGWGVACRRLGIIEHGVENMPAALATREANGMSTAYEDVWDGLTHPTIVPGHNVQIASPPCQSFSMAGAGAGRRALDDVLRLLEEGVYKRPSDLRDLTRAADFDDKTALVLTPLAYAYQWRPTFIAWEQVPAVLPVWEAAARELRTIGYSVAVAILNAEQYGVPQTRRRAILVARNDGQEARLPTPTHSRFYSHQPSKLDPGVRRWVTMAEALGWQEADGHLRSNYGTGGDPSRRGKRTLDQPSPTLTSKADRNKWVRGEDSPPLTADEAAALQTYPIAMTAEPGASLLGADGAKPHRMTGEPAFTITGGAPNGEGGGQRHRWALTASGLYRQGIADTRLIDQAERARLQSFPDGFTFAGTKGQQFLQIGNAVPPLLAEHVLAAITAGDLTTGAGG